MVVPLRALTSVVCYRNTIFLVQGIEVKCRFATVLSNCYLGIDRNSHEIGSHLAHEDIPAWTCAHNHTRACTPRQDFSSWLHCHTNTDTLLPSWSWTISSPFCGQSKLSDCAHNIWHSLNDTVSFKSTQFLQLLLLKSLSLYFLNIKENWQCQKSVLPTSN